MENTNIMEEFFANLDPALSTSIKEIIPESLLSDTVANYNGPNTKEGHLESLVSFLTSKVNELQNPSVRDKEKLKSALGLLGLCQSALNDWASTADTWGKIVDIDDETTINDHPKRDLAAIFNLGIALNQLERWPEAEGIFTRLLPMLEAAPNLGKTSQQYAGTLSALMVAVGKQGRVEDARKLYSEHADVVSQFEEPDYSAHAGPAKKILSNIEHDARER